MSQKESNSNYGRIALMNGEYSVNNFGEERNVTGRLVAIENSVKLFMYDSLNGKQREFYRFIHCEESEDYTIAGLCLAKNAAIIDEDNIESSLREAWINGFHRKTLLQKVIYPFKSKPRIPLERLMKEYTVIKDVRDSFVEISSPSK